MLVDGMWFWIVDICKGIEVGVGRDVILYILVEG